MPELPEVETCLRGIAPHIIQQIVTTIMIRHAKLRWPITAHLEDKIKGKQLKKLTRRGKYLLFQFENGVLIVHLGMSGKLRLLPIDSKVQKHDHVDIYFSNNICLRFTDPRRFGAILWTESAASHPLLVEIGPEPLTANFNGKYLWHTAKQKKLPIKSFLMNSKIVAGIGNIYATEALFEAGIHPSKPAGKISLVRYQKLATAIKIILKKALKKGGTTLKDFTKSDGSPGYFRLELKVYGRSDEPCPNCKTPLKSKKIAKRSTVYCSRCQV